MRIAALALGLGLGLAPALGGCATRVEWGHSATLLPGGPRLGSAAISALADPFTWVPAAGAVLFLATDADRPVSDWAREQTPLFGSTSSALDASDGLRDTCIYAAGATALLAPSGTQAGEIAWHKAKGLAVELAAGWVNREATLLGKDASDRLRPDGSDRESFPSGHTSTAATGAVLTRRNLEAIPMDRRVRWFSEATISGAAMLTGWARVEAGKHYPSDVLAGYALGNAIGAFVHDAFLGRTSPANVWLSVGPDARGVGCSLHVAW